MLYITRKSKSLSEPPRFIVLSIKERKTRVHRGRAFLKTTSTINTEETNVL